MRLGQIHVRILENREKRFNKFIDLFRALTADGHGRLEDFYYIVNSDVYLQHFRNKEEKVFTLIQRDTQSKGIVYNMYLLSND